MDKILTPLVTSISDFRADMPGTLKRSKGEPFAVLVNNKPSFYVLSPEQYDQMLELLFDAEITPVIEKRLEQSKGQRVRVNPAEF